MKERFSLHAQFGSVGNVENLNKMQINPNRKQLIKYVSLIVLTLHSALLAVSMRYARTRAGNMFISSTAVLMPEFVKLLICLLLVYNQENKNFRKFINSLRKTIIESYADTLKVCVPSLIFNIQNNLIYIAASHLDAVTHQVTYQMKILTTAMFTVVIFQRKLLKTQWAALVLLIMGVVLVQLAQKDSTSVEQIVNTEAVIPTKQNRILGLWAALAAGVLSGFAGVYFEKMLKGATLSVWMRNLQLSMLSIPLGILTCLINDGDNIFTKGFFFGYDIFLWYLILLQAGGGLVVAVVVKYADNILKSFATALAIVLACIASIFIFDFNLTLHFAIGTALVIASIFLYGFNPKKDPIKSRSHIV